ncbi:MAG: adenylyltransferase/cytidyltransferase family protein [Candidatus Heimdallarchaeota archaeon]|nr:adenylyltransferase/cytidyltransferase family protein [Candidatus Heimdallarchaeota archaeon]
MANTKPVRVITFGTYDLFHVGHLNILKRARELGDYLIVGVSTDKLNFSKKQKYPVYSEDDRKSIVLAIKYVDEVFDEESLELKGEYIKKYNADILVMGNDWEGKFDWCKEYCDVVYLPRTPVISTTNIKNTIIEENL